jgi:putative transposase
MKPSWFTEEQIIGILREKEAGACDGRRPPQARDQQRDLLQMEGQVRRAGGSDAKRLKALEDENAKLKKLLAEAMLDDAMLKDVASKKW